MIDRIKEWFFLSDIRRQQKTKHRKNRYTNIESAQSIGVLCSELSQEDQKIIAKYCDRLFDTKRNISFLVYYNQKDACTENNFPCFSKKDIDWIYRPKNGTAKQFMLSSYDILICLDKQLHKSVEYISAVCDAKMKIGSNAHPNVRYDLIIESKEKDGWKGFFDALKEVLQKININREHANV